MRCPNCQTVNPINAKYCLECGNRLLLCPQCGTINLPFAKFCIECGTPLHAQLALSATNHAQTAGISSTQTVLPSGDTEPMLPSLSATVPLSAPDMSLVSGTGLLPPEERRVVTVMFADITGSTPLADRLDPEEMRAILTGYFNLMTEQLRKHGGTVEKYIGDAVMAVFGMPVTHEDDPDRAIRAALDMQAALTLFNEQRLVHDASVARLQMRIGINTGEVAAPGNSQPQRQDFLITGDAVNVAARLQQAAAPDAILVGERTYLATRDVFSFRPVAPLHLKGKPELVPSYVVLGLNQHTLTIMQHPRGIAGQQASLVGRQLELTLMHANYARVQAERHPHLITLLGVPGIGKSRLVRDFIAREQEAIKSASSLGNILPPRVLAGRCPPYGEGITYWPLIEVLRSLLHAEEETSFETLQQRFTDFVAVTLVSAKRAEATEEVVAPILRSIGSRFGTSSPRPTTTAHGRERARRELQRKIATSGIKQSSTQLELLRAWRVLLEALAQQQPLIIVIDDLQWADEALLDLLEYLTDRITTVPILFLCPARPDFFERRRDWGGGRRNFTTIELDALNTDETNELINELLNTDETPTVLRNTIQTRAEGNPFFVEEIIRMLIDQGLLVCEEDATGHDCWRVQSGATALLSNLSAPGEHIDDTLINMHYLLPLRVPDTVQGVLAARIDLLDTQEKLVLQHAAIIGRTFWLSSLRELASETDGIALQNALQSLILRDFIIETVQQVNTPVAHDSIFSFKHVLIRDVVYSTIPRMRRSLEHARLALWLESLLNDESARFVELLAYHFQQALTNWSPGFSLSSQESSPEALRLNRVDLRRRAILYLTKAGDQALHSYYTLRALQAYRDAIELLEETAGDQAERITMYEKLGAAYMQRGNLDEAWQEYRKALRIATSAEATSEQQHITLLSLYERLAELATRWLSGFDTLPDMQEVWGYIDAGLQLLPTQPLSASRVALLTYLAFWHTRQLETATFAQKAALAEQALASGHTALQLAEQLNNSNALSLTLDALGFIYSQYHKYTEAHEIQHRRQMLEQALTDREERYDVYLSLGYAHEQIADYASALTWFGHAWRHAQTMESPSMLLNSLVGRMRAWRQWNRWQEATEVAHEILQLIARYQQDEKRQFWALETLATIAYRRGNREQGDLYALQCKRLLDQQLAHLVPTNRSGENEQHALATRMHAIHLASEDWLHATADYRAKLQMSEPMPSPEVLSTLAELLVMTGEEQEQQHLICTRAVQSASESGARKSLLVALRARGRMHLEQQHWQQAEDDLRQSQHYCEALDLPWERAQTLYHLGLLYRRRASALYGQDENKRNADLGRARNHFEQALGFFQTLGAIPGEERVRLALMQDNQAPV